MMHTCKTLFIFRRDLRLEDNTALIAALRASSTVIPCFIFDPRQIGDQPYKSYSAIQFMVASLLELEEELIRKGHRLYIFEGEAGDIVGKIIKSEHIDAVYFNKDYTPFSQKRDEEISQICQKAGIACHSFHDALLNPPDAVKKDDGGVYSIYTPYARKAMTFEVPGPVTNTFKNYDDKPIAIEKRTFFNSMRLKINKNGLYPAGRLAALKILNNMDQFKQYDQERNFPGLSATTGLSAHHKFGTCSIRESYHAIRSVLGFDHTLIRELYWRDFFTQIGFHYPKVLGQSFHAQYDNINWENDPIKFQQWCDGKTGFPIVDAGMRELNTTGFMHNRVRMITASFLVKDLHIDWRWGEKYFAQKLIDYDPLVNNGNWQWAASTGCDAQPYFRIFNPWLQQEKFDPKAVYIRRWIPELRILSLKDIHRLQKAKSSYVSNYPVAIEDHKLEAQRSLAMYKSVKGNGQKMACCI